MFFVDLINEPFGVQIVFDQRLNFDLPRQKIYNKTKSVENNLVKVYIFKLIPRRHRKLTKSAKLEFLLTRSSHGVFALTDYC